MIHLYLVRHGKTMWNQKGFVQGTRDIDMCEEGIEAVKELSKSIAIDDIDVCFSSPLKRAYDTAKILTGGKKEIIINDLIIERCYGDYEGTVKNREVTDRQWDYKLNDSTHGIEPLRDCLDRASRFIDYLKNNFDNKTVLVVSHGAFIRCIHFVILGFTEDTKFKDFKPENSAIYEYTLN